MSCLNGIEFKNKPSVLSLFFISGRPLKTTPVIMSEELDNIDINFNQFKLDRIIEIMNNNALSNDIQNSEIRKILNIDTKIRMFDKYKYAHEIEKILKKN